MGLTRPRAYQIFDIDYKQSVRVVAVADVTLAGGAPNQVDGVNLSTNDRVLVTGQSTASQNGLYYVTTVGTGSNGTWQRSVDGNETGEIDAGMVVMVTEGNVYADTQWKLITDDPIVIGTTALVFVQNYSANSITGGNSNVVVNSNSNVTISVAGASNVLNVTSTGLIVAGNILPSANITYNLGANTARFKDLWLSNSTIYLGNVTLGATATELTVNGATVVTSSGSSTLSLSGNITGGNLLTGGLISATANVTGGNILTTGQVSASGNITGGNILGGANVNAITHTGTTVSVTANVSGGNITTGGQVSATGNITGGNISGTNLTGTLTTASQPNITSLGTLTSLNSGAISSSGNITGGNLITGGIVNVTSNITGGNVLTAGQVSAAGNITGGNILGGANVNATTHTGTTVSVTANVTGGNILTSGIVSATGNVNGGNIISGALVQGAIVSASGNVVGGNLTTSGQISSTSNITGGNVLTGGLISATSTITSSANITGGNVLTGGRVSANGNVAGGNLVTAGQISATGTITTAGGTNSTGFAVGNGAVSNVGLGFFPTAGTRGDYAIRDYSNVTSTMYFDVGMGGSPAGEFQFRTSNAFTLLMRANSTGVYSSGVVSATGIVSGLELTSTQSSGDEGGQLNLAKAATNTTLAGNVIVDIYQNRFRIFENGGTNRGAYIDLTAAAASVGTNLLAGGGTPGGSNTYVQFNDGGVFGGNAQFTYDKVLNTLTAGTFAGTLNGSGQNFKVGDDAWIGDINTADTIGLKGQQNAANCYIVFGNSDSTGKLGRAGTGPLTYAGAFSATSNVTGGNILTGGIVSATGNITGSYIIGNGSQLTGLPAGYSNATAASFLAAFGSNTISTTGNITSGNTLTGILYTNTGNTTGSAIVNSGANGVGNIGSSTGYFNVAHVRATSAQYADLAENYIADAEYEPGTVLVFGGEFEVTQSTQHTDPRVAGVVSTHPAYLMNSGLNEAFTVPVAFQGRVPCRVQGPVNKGDVLVTGTVPGVAQRIWTDWQPGCTLGKSLDTILDNTINVIEIVVGRF
jgi:hypothetical protein